MRFAQGARRRDKLREVPRPQRRPVAPSLQHFERAYPFRREAIARAFRTGVYTMQGIGDYFGVHYSTVSRALRRLERGEKEGA